MKIKSKERKQRAKTRRVKTRRVKCKSIFISLILLLPILFSCSNTKSEIKEEITEPPVQKETELMNTLQQMFSILEIEDAFTFMENVSEEYVPSKLSFKIDIDDSFRNYYGYAFRIISHKININDKYGTIILEWRRSRVKRETGSHEIIDGNSELKFVLEENKWKLLQQNGDIIFN